MNIHFGYFRWGVNPFRLESLLAQMNREVFRRLEMPPPSPPIISEPDPSHMRPCRPHYILDIGCGCGATMIDLSKILPSAKFHGATLSEKQVSIGKKTVARAGLADRIHFHDADFQNLPFGQNFADAAILLESACYADGPDKALLIDEISRVLRPGGRVVIVDGFRRHSNPLPAFLEKIYRKNMRHWHLTELADIQLFAKKMEQAGFENIRVEDVSWRVFPSVLHIPFVAFRLFFKNTSPAKKRYAKALLHTLFMGLFRRHFGYFIVTGDRG